MFGQIFVAPALLPVKPKFPKFTACTWTAGALSRVMFFLNEPLKGWMEMTAAKTQKLIANC